MSRIVTICVLLCTFLVPVVAGADAAPSVMVDAAPIHVMDAGTASSSIDAAPPVVAAVVLPAEVAPSALSRFLSQVSSIIFSILGLLLAFFGLKFIKLISARFGVDIPEATMTTWIDKGIAYANEQAHKAIRANNEKLTMDVKLETAAGFVMDMADKLDAGKLGKEKLKKLIEARLGQRRPT